LRRPLDEYLEGIADLPAPTDEQLSHFCRHMLVSHSWYKLSMLHPTPFTFFLNADVRADLASDGSREEYLDKFGYIDYRWAFKPLGDSHRYIPEEVMALGTTRLHPYVSSQRNAYNLIWSRNDGALEEYEKIAHPDFELLKLLQSKRAAIEKVAKEAGSIYGINKFIDVLGLIKHEKSIAELGERGARWKDDYAGKVSEGELTVLREWCKRHDDAQAEAQSVYKKLNEREEAKVMDALVKLRNWKAGLSN